MCQICFSFLKIRVGEATKKEIFTFHQGWFSCILFPFILTNYLFTEWTCLYIVNMAFKGKQFMKSSRVVFNPLSSNNVLSTIKQVKRTVWINKVFIIFIFCMQCCLILICLIFKAWVFKSSCNLSQTVYTKFQLHFFFPINVIHETKIIASKNHIFWHY